jgi:hypothetical protein
VVTVRPITLCPIMLCPITLCLITKGSEPVHDFVSAATEVVME